MPAVTCLVSNFGAMNVSITQNCSINSTLPTSHLLHHNTISATRRCLHMSHTDCDDSDKPKDSENSIDDANEYYQNYQQLAQGGIITPPMPMNLADPPSDREPDQHPAELTHTDSSGKVCMVDVGSKPITTRVARASGTIAMSPAAYKLVAENRSKKGDVLTTAQLAGIMAAKQTSHLIPLCHNINLNKIDVRLELDDRGCCVRGVSTVRCSGHTGVEMEALVAVSVALLTVYDMCKAVDKAMCISDVKLVSKTGGQGGDYHSE